MLPRLSVVIRIASLAVISAFVLSGCPSSQKRDQNYGNDAGLDYQPPDAAAFTSQPVADASTPDADTVDVTADTGLETPAADASTPETGPGADSASVDSAGPGVDSIGVDSVGVDSSGTDS